MGSAALGRDHDRVFQSGPTAGVSTSVRRADRFADPPRPRTLERSGKAVIHPSSLRSDDRCNRWRVAKRETGAKRWFVMCPTSERSEEGAKRSAYHCVGGCVVSVGPRAKPGGFVGVTLRGCARLVGGIKRNCGRNGCFLWSLSLQQQRK